MAPSLKKARSHFIKTNSTYLERFETILVEPIKPTVIRPRASTNQALLDPCETRKPALPVDGTVGAATPVDARVKPLAADGAPPALQVNEALVVEPFNEKPIEEPAAALHSPRST